MGLSENSEKMASIGWPRSVSTTARAAVVSKGVMLSWSLDSSCITGTGSTSGLRHSTPQACLRVIGIPWQYNVVSEQCSGGLMPMSLPVRAGDPTQREIGDGQDVPD